VDQHETHCETCQTEMLFEAPPCEDDHGDDCPELLCTGCGAAFLIAPIATVRAWLRPLGTSIAPQQRRAA
jgi:MinD superfamily P-loop ATPase